MRHIFQKLSKIFLNSFEFSLRRCQYFLINSQNFLDNFVNFVLKSPNFQRILQQWYPNFPSNVPKFFCFSKPKNEKFRTFGNVINYFQKLWESYPETSILTQNFVNSNATAGCGDKFSGSRHFDEMREYWWIKLQFWERNYEGL